MVRKPDDDAAHWSVDRKIPIAVILAILVQTAGGVWWLSSINSRVNALERADTVARAIVQQQSDRIDRTETARIIMDGRLIRVEERTETILEVVKKTDAKLDRLLQPIPR
mgnify:FL=1